MKLVSLLLLFASALVSPGFSADLNVFVAASLSDALTELGKAYEVRSGDNLHFNFAASSTLARQIKEGAPADVFFSADEEKMNDLSKAKLIVSASRRTLLSNTLVLVVARDQGPSLTQAEDLLKPTIRHLALGETQTVPAGIYARVYLEKKNLWNKLSEKVVAQESVRAALAAVEAGNADAAIVYKTDALISKKVKIAFEVPGSEGPKIAYPVAVLQPSKHHEAAQAFVDYLASPDAHHVFEKYGFRPAD